MKAVSLAIVAIVLEISVVRASAADDSIVERMAMCRDSWLDWKKNDQAQLKKFGDHIGSLLSDDESGGGYRTTTSISVAGMRVTRVFPENVGMGVGFSVLVEASFDTARKTAERILGKPLAKCESGENMRTCELEIAEKRTFTLLAEENSKSASTLLGCYYYYEK